ncbi:MAG: hypothetical protein IT235_07955 [Bacteroidia bacterium]|nr:hypothetical protein [Bacteroidia bacterium]
MLVRFFRLHQPILLIVIPLIAALLWIPAFLYPIVPDIKYAMPLYEWVVRLLLHHAWLLSVVAYVLIVIQAFLFNYITDKFELIGKSSYLPALMYVIFTSFSRDLLLLHPMLFANIFILLTLNHVLNMYRLPSAQPQSFNAGFMVAVASLFYFPAAFLLLFVFISIIILRPFFWREWVIVILGFLLPYIYINTWYFLINGFDSFWIDKVIYPFAHRAAAINADIAQLYFELALFVLIAIAFSVGRGSDTSTHSVQHRSRTAVLRWLFICAALTLLVAPGFNYIYFFIGLIPLLIIISVYFLWARMIWLTEVIMWMLAVTIAFNYFTAR